MLSKVEKAYIAGIIDGEGTITLAKTGTPYRRPYVAVATTDKELLDWLQDKLGGSIGSKKLYNEAHKPSWYWCVKDSSAVALLKEVLPFFVIERRKRRAIALIEYAKTTKRNGFYTPSQKKERLTAMEAFFSV